MARLPSPPAETVLREIFRPAEDVVTVHPETRLTRIFSARSSHPQTWNAFREVGPLPHARFDPQQPAADGRPVVDSGVGVLYFGLSVRTCVAEVFQSTSAVDRDTKGPHVVVLRPRRPLRLLDLTGLWPTRAGGSQEISSGPKAMTQRWARAIRAAHPDLDGVWYRSSMDSGAPAICLWDPPASSALPDEPDFLDELRSTGLDVPLGRICRELNYMLLPRN
jgi:hypothetical protein